MRELLEGRGLQEHLEDKPLSVKQSLDYALQITRVLSVAHERGIVHGDLKPTNVTISLEGCVKIIGFGKRFTPPTLDAKVSTVLKFSEYSAPEQLLEEKWDYRADIFAFGIMLYEMLTGAHPFRRDSRAKTARAIFQDDPPAPSAIDHEIPRGFDLLVQSCLAKNRAKRFHSTRGLVAELEALSEECS